MRSVTKIRIVFAWIIIALVLSISNVNYKQTSKTEVNTVLDDKSEEINPDQNELKVSGDNEYIEVWSSTNNILKQKEFFQAGSMDKDGKKEIIIEAITGFYLFEYNATYANYTLVWTKNLKNTMYLVWTKNLKNTINYQYSLSSSFIKSLLK